MKTNVLTVARNQILRYSQIVPTEQGMFPIDLFAIPADAYNFVNRSIADTLAESGLDFEFAQAHPQLLGYVTIQDPDGNILSYSRGNTGGETRLAGSRSIGIGGHTDIEDAQLFGQPGSRFIDGVRTLQRSIERELEEEIGLSVALDAKCLSKVIASFNDPASAVHLGLWFTITVLREDVKKTDEIHDLQWLSLAQLESDIDAYEPWSKIVINQLKPKD